MMGIETIRNISNVAAYRAAEEGRHPLTDDPEEEIVHGDDCTGNLCPSCAGPYLEPDDPDDPRRPKEA